MPLTDERLKLDSMKAYTERRTCMTTPILTQNETDNLIDMRKRRIDDKEWQYPGLGGGISVPLVSFDERERFILDIRRSRINLQRGSYQSRGRRVVVLVRLCFGSTSHTNPDGNEVGLPHIHIYREGYGDKWAYPVTAAEFGNLGDQWQTFQDFMQHCNIVEAPNIVRGLSA